MYNIIYLADAKSFLFISESGHHLFAMLCHIIFTIIAIAMGSSVFFHKVFVSSGL